MNQEKMHDGPLTGIRVLEVGHALAGPFACSLLADLGAEVIKIEKVGSGDDLRSQGLTHEGVGLWWTVTGRNKRSMTLDLKSDDGRAILRDLVKVSDVFMENFRPGVVERMGFGWAQLEALNPDLIMLRVSGFGQSGPYSNRRGFGKIGEAFSGATNLTGSHDEPPVHPGYSLADTVTGVFGAFGVTAALRSRDAGHGGQYIDLALYEGLFRMIEWQIPYASHLGFNATRNGAMFPFGQAFLTGIWPANDGVYIVVSAATSTTVERIFGLVKAKGLLPSVEWSEAQNDVQGIADAVAAWIAQTDSREVLDEFDRVGAVAGEVYEPSMMLDNEHLVDRQNVVSFEHPILGSTLMPGVVPSLHKTPGRIRTPAPSLGENTDEILAELLTYSPDRIAALRSSGAI